MEPDKFDHYGDTQPLATTEDEVQCKGRVVMQMLERIERQIADMQYARQLEVMEWSTWREKMDAHTDNLGERLSEIRHMYEQIVEVLPIARRTEAGVEEIMQWIALGGHVVKRYTAN